MRVLIDTPVWIDHLHRNDPILRRLLLDGTVCLASPILGELIAGNLPDRARTIADLRLLPRLKEPRPDDVFDWVEVNGLGGTGLSWVDCLLLAMAQENGVSLWTRDRSLDRAARRLMLAYETR